MSVLHRRAYRAEKAEPFGDRQLVIVAILIQRLALDVLHNEVRLAIFRAAAFQQAGDVGMLEAGENLPFGFEASQRKPGVEAAAHTVDRDLFLVLVSDAHGPIDRAHSSFADLFDDSIRAYATALPGFRFAPYEHLGVTGERGLIQKLTRLLVRQYQGFDVPTHRRLLARLIQVWTSLLGRKVEDRIHYFPNLVPWDGRHASLLGFELVIKPGPCARPLPVDRRCGQVHNVGDFFDRKSSEKFQFHDLRTLLVHDF